MHGADYYSNLALIAALPPTDVGGPVTGYNSCVQRARIVFDGELKENDIIFAAGVAALTLAVSVAAAICLSTIVVPVFGWLFSGSCALKTAAEAALGMVALLGNKDFNSFNTAKELCCFDWPDSCPNDPV